jgi:Flp pilus assembly protein TadD
MAKGGSFFGTSVGLLKQTFSEWLLTLRRDFAGAEKIVENLPAESWRSNWRRPQLLGQMQRALGQKERARESFQQARALLTTAIAKGPEEPLTHADLALVDAGLGRAAEALREAGRAIDLQPVEKMRSGVHNGWKTLRKSMRTSAELTKRSSCSRGCSRCRMI